MGTRRDDIPVTDRMQMALVVLTPHREPGTLTQLAQQYHLSRQALYDLAARAREILTKGLEPGRHGPHPAERVLCVDRNRLVRSALALTEVGVSQRDIEFVLTEVLDTSVSPSWVNGQLAQLEARAAQCNANWHPSVGEGLAGDELFASQQPNLLVVGNDSLYIYALTQQPECDGETWGCVLLDAPASPQFASDGGTGLAKGVVEAGRSTHQLDWDHLLRPLWQYDAQLERQAYAALAALEDRRHLFEQAHTAKRLARHLAHWEQLEREATEAITRYDRFHTLAQQVDAEFAMLDVTSGAVREATTSAAHLREVAEQIKVLPGRVCQVLGTSLGHWAEGWVSYLPRLEQAVAPLVEKWGSSGVHALSRIWQVEAEIQRGHLTPHQRGQLEQIWQASLDEAAQCLGEQWFAVWEDLSAIVGRIWRGSMAAECVNSLLRPLLNARKHADQGGLELFRFLHNTHRFARGKRAGDSPAELVGIALPADRYALLGLAPKVSI